MRPEIDQVRSYCRVKIWDEVLSEDCGDRISVRASLARHLQSLGVGSRTSEEFAEAQLAFACAEIDDVICEWDLLGIPSPARLKAQGGVLLTWKHSRFSEITEKPALSKNFPSFWRLIKDSDPTELLFYLAAYLYCLGCDKIFITDRPGDGGIDLVGVKNTGPLKGLCILVQSKYADNFVKADSFLCDYAKSILAEKTGRWRRYADEIGISRNRDGFSRAYFFATNQEFGRSIQGTAQELGISLRSGKQIAYALSENFTPQSISEIRSRVGKIGPSTKLDYKTVFSGAA